MARITQVPLSEPGFVRALLTDVRWAWIWLPLRLWLGWQWLTAGWGKINNPAWMDTGTAVKGFWERAVIIPANGRPTVAFDWYRDFLQFMLDGGHHVWFGKLIAVGEFAVGIALILGAFVLVAGFFGVFMNWNFVMAGAASVNGMEAFVGVLLIVAWRVAGWWGFDRLPITLLSRRAMKGAEATEEPEDAKERRGGAGNIVPQPAR